MIGTKFTLVADTATKIVDSTKGGGRRSVLIKTALTDLAFGGPTVTVATGYNTGASMTNVPIDCGEDDLYARSTGGGVLYVLYPENG